MSGLVSTLRARAETAERHRDYNGGTCRHDWLTRLAEDLREAAARLERLTGEVALLESAVDGWKRELDRRDVESPGPRTEETAWALVNAHARAVEGCCEEVRSRLSWQSRRGRLDQAQDALMEALTRAAPPASAVSIESAGAP